MRFLTASDEQQLDAVVDLVVGTFGDSVVGAYQYGSAVMGGLRPHSDVDVFVLIDRSTTAGERRHLVSKLKEISCRPETAAAGRPIELTIARLDELAPWSADPRREFQYGEWLRSDYEAGFVPGPASDPDLAPLVATLLTASRRLLGPQPSDVLGPVPHDQLVEAMRQGVAALLDELADDTTNVLLTLARMAYTARSGRIASKDDAAQWAVDRLPADARAPLVLARRIYLGETDESEASRLDRDTLSSAQRLAEMIEDG